MLTEELLEADTATDAPPVKSDAVMSEDVYADPADASAPPLFSSPVLDRIRTSD